MLLTFVATHVASKNNAAHTCNTYASIFNRTHRNFSLFTIFSGKVKIAGAVEAIYVFLACSEKTRSVIA